MRDPRMVAVVFESFVRIVGAARFVRGNLAAFCVLGAGLVIGLSDPAVQRQLAASTQEQQESLEQTLVADGPLGREHLRTPTLLAFDSDAVFDVLPAPRLNNAQALVATHISRSYRIALQRTQHYVDLAFRVAAEKDLDPLLVLALIGVESSFNSQAQSSKGAQGLMQVLTRVHAEKFEPFGGAVAAFDPRANITVGARILREYLQRDGTLETALKFYVGAALMAHDGGYGARVLAERERLNAVATGRIAPGDPSLRSLQPQDQRASPATLPTIDRLEGEPALSAPAPIDLKPIEGKDSAAL
jgi:soluble lytic murein transglycosylase-like protein